MKMSTDDPTEEEVARAWGVEIERRLAEVRAGNVKSVSKDEVLKLMRMGSEVAREYLALDTKGRYQLLTREWLATRAVAGGTLTQEEEVSFISPLDDLWHRMTPEEQAEIEAWALARNVNAPEDLGLEDMEGGTHRRPVPR